jgi:protein-disulfide isomerase
MQLRTMTAPLCILTLAATTARVQPDPLAGRTKGLATAPVTVYEMSDFQCPYCKRHVDKTFPTLEKEYIATGKVRWIFINYPLPSLHSNAIAAAEFAMCAERQGKFWPAHDLLYRLQPAWAPLKDPTPFFFGIADSLKLAKAQVTACVQQRETRDEVKDDADGAAKAAGGQGTPTFYIEGGLLTGALPPEIWRPILDSVYLAKTHKKP